MEDHWRPARTLAWHTLDGMSDREGMLYHYIVSGPHTSRCRVMVCRMAHLAVARNTNKATVRRCLDALADAGLIVWQLHGSVVTAYPVGSFLKCSAGRGNSLAGVVGALGRVPQGKPRDAAASDLGLPPDFESEVIETTAPGRTLANRKRDASESQAKRQERKASGKEDTPVVPSEGTVADAPKTQRAKRKKAEARPKDAAAVQDYAAEYAEGKGVAINATFGERFVNHYAAKDWKVGKSPVKDWRRCVHTWVLKRQDDGSRLRPGQKNPRSGQQPPPQQAKRKQIWDCETKEEWLALKEAEQPNAPDYTRHAWERHWQAHISDPNNGRTT